ncbi:MAG: hypothetical protein QXR76_03235 [Candidatus Bathyarchaeia archaeon]
MRLVSYLFMAAVLAVVCFAYVQFWWMLVQGELPQVSSWLMPSSNFSTDVDVNVDASATIIVTRMGLPIYASGFPYLWPVHMLFFTVLWTSFLMVAFIDLVWRIRLG